MNKKTCKNGINNKNKKDNNTDKMKETTKIDVLEFLSIKDGDTGHTLIEKRG